MTKNSLFGNIILVIQSGIKMIDSYFLTQEEIEYIKSETPEEERIGIIENNLIEDYLSPAPSYVEKLKETKKNNEASIIESNLIKDYLTPTLNFYTEKSENYKSTNQYNQI